MRKTKQKPELPPEVRDYLSRIGKAGGAIGGKVAAQNMSRAERVQRATKASEAAAKKMTPKQRRERARKASQARWAAPEK